MVNLFLKLLLVMQSTSNIVLKLIYKNIVLKLIIFEIFTKWMFKGIILSRKHELVKKKDLVNIFVSIQNIVQFILNQYHKTHFPQTYIIQIPPTELTIKTHKQC